MTLFYTLPATALVEGVSTDDGQDVLAVHRNGDSISATVYTPRSDDPDIDTLNRTQPETRLFRCHGMVELAVFTDTQVDLSDHASAQDVRVVDDGVRRPG